VNDADVIAFVVIPALLLLVACMFVLELRR
jgi:phosphatidylserine synthase